MQEFKIGDIVARKSYNYDILFRIRSITGDIADLVGITVRIVADAPLYDLVYVPNDKAERQIKANETNSRYKLNRCYNRIYNKQNNYNNFNFKAVQRDATNKYLINQENTTYKKPGVILHLDGDKEYADKCKDTYSKMGLVSYVYNISEIEQPRYVYSMLQKVRPNILILTGHDAFSRKSNDIYNINNYKNSKNFVEAILEARRYEHSLDELVIYAGACQSYFEALITAGANFASSPKRVLIDLNDPIVVAEAVAFSPVDKFVSIPNIIANTREGVKGIGGIQTRRTI